MCHVTGEALCGKPHFREPVTDEVMAAKEIASDVSSRAALCGRCLPRQAPTPSARCVPRRTVCAGRSTGGGRDPPSHVVRAVAAPEKASITPPPFEAWNTGKDVKQRTDIKTIMILGAGPIVIGQVRHCCVLCHDRQFH